MAITLTVLPENDTDKEQDGTEVAVADNNSLEALIDRIFAPRRPSAPKSRDERLSPREPYGFD